MSECQLTVEPFFQCCCTCIYRKTVNYHCCTEPKPPRESYEGRCCCGVVKGYTCSIPDSDRVYDNWPEHSCGCELHTTKEQDNKYREYRKLADKFTNTFTEEEMQERLRDIQTQKDLLKI